MMGIPPVRGQPGVGKADTAKVAGDHDEDAPGEEAFIFSFGSGGKVIFNLTENNIIASGNTIPSSGPFRTAPGIREPSLDAQE